MSLKTRKRLALTLAPIMFFLSLAFLACLATMVVLWVDVPGLSEHAFDEPIAGDEEVDSSIAKQNALTAGEVKKIAFEQDTTQDLFHGGVVILMLAMWPVFWFEAGYHIATRPWNARFRTNHLRSLACCILPPLRICARVPELGDAMWFPMIGWRTRNDALRDDLTKFFGVPMIGIAILILPVLGIEFLLKDQVAQYASLRFGLHFSTGLIWFAFTTEFIVMFSAAEDRIDYCKKHWLDLAIILLPLISFLRSLQIVRATRLAKLTKVQQLSKMARVYRLRGVSTKALRAFLLLELAQKLIQPKPAKQLVKLRAEHRRRLKELKELEAKIASIEAQLAAEQTNTVAEQGI